MYERQDVTHHVLRLIVRDECRSLDLLKHHVRQESRRIGLSCELKIASWGQ